MTAGDEGGETPCFAHLLGEPPRLTDEALAGLLRDLADAVVIADPEGTITFCAQSGELLEVCAGKCLHPACAGVAQPDADNPLILAVANAFDEPAGEGATNELHDAVMAQEQVVSHLADRRRLVAPRAR